MLRNITIILFAGLLTGSCLLWASEEESAEPQEPQEPVIQFQQPSPKSTTSIYAKVVKEVGPAVVNIFAHRIVRQQNFSPLLEDPFFRHFFGDDFFMGESPPTRIQRSLGSGVIVRPDGVIISNYHVIKNAEEIKIVLSDGRELHADVVAQEPRTDLVALKIKNPPENLPFLPLKDVDELEVGDEVLAIGNPFGLGQTVTRGIISALARTQLGVSDFRSFIQTDAAINPGNSGGALVTMDGKLAGINTAILSKTGGSIGIGFAIPSNLVIPLIESLEYGGKIIRPWIGAAVQNVTQDRAEQYGLDYPTGVIITGIYPDSPAAQAGLEVGDLILNFDGKEIKNRSAFIFRVASRPVTHKARLEILKRGRERLEKEVQLAAPPEAADKGSVKLRGRHPLEGANVANLSPALATNLGVDFMEKGVIILSVDQGSVARRVGLLPGDIIQSINGQVVENIDGLARRVLRARSDWQSGSRVGWKIEIKRGGKSYTLVLQ